MALPAGWQRVLLRRLRAPATPENLRFLNAWQKAEGGGTANNANFNPLNTTQGASGASSINGVGVKSYRSPQQGVNATLATLLNGHYNQIVQHLRSGHATAAQLGTDVSHSPWGTGSGVLRVLGSGAVSSSAPAPGNLGAPASAASPGGGGVNPLAQLLLQQSLETAQGHGPDFGGLIALAQQRQQLGAAQATYGPQPTKGPVMPQINGKGPGFIGDIHGENAAFLNKLKSAAAAVGGTKIRVTSGYRSPSHNAAVGGVPNSNHTTGHAMDGDVFIPRRGWVPLGVALRTIAGRYGLRSGDQPGFYHGGVDPVHVDDGFNQH